MGCIPNFREIGDILLDQILLIFKDMGYKCVVTNKVVNGASPYIFLKQLLMGVLHFKDWGKHCHLAAITVVLALE